MVCKNYYSDSDRKNNFREDPKVKTCFAGLRVANSTFPHDYRRNKKTKIDLFPTLNDIREESLEPRFFKFQTCLLLKLASKVLNTSKLSGTIKVCQTHNYSTYYLVRIFKA